MMMERQRLAIAQSISVALTGSYESFSEICLCLHQHLVTNKAF